VVVRLAGGRAKDTKGECRGRRQIAYSDTVTTKLKIRTYMVVDERGCTPPARDVATGTFHHLIYQVNSSSSAPAAGTRRELRAPQALPRGSPTSFSRAASVGRAKASARSRATRQSSIEQGWASAGRGSAQRVRVTSDHATVSVAVDPWGSSHRLYSPTYPSLSVPTRSSCERAAARAAHMVGHPCMETEHHTSTRLTVPPPR
jgi:hypothetical protein